MQASNRHPTDRRLRHAAVQVSDVVVLEHGSRLVRVEGVELLGAVLAGANGDGFASPGVILEEVGDVIHLNREIEPNHARVRVFDVRHLELSSLEKMLSDSLHASAHDQCIMGIQRSTKTWSSWNIRRRISVCTGLQNLQRCVTCLSPCFLHDTTNDELLCFARSWCPLPLDSTFTGLTLHVTLAPGIYYNLPRI